MIRSLSARLRSLWRGVRRRSDIEADMDEEFRLHADLRARDLARGGMPPEQALRVARQEFGSPARFKEAARASRGLHRIDQIRFSWLDFKLGFRMLARYPGLTVVGCLAIAVAIAVGALYFEVFTKFQRPRLPLADGDRIVSISVWDVSKRSPETRSLHDFAVWREQMHTLVDLGAALNFQRNLITEDRRAESVRGAEITASAFRLARVPPLMGRTLLPRDEEPGAPPVAVLGFSLWKARFDSDPNIIGRTIKLGSAVATVVGVMPKGFGFPVNHRIWTPLRVNGALLAPRSGPGVTIFARLADGVSQKEAQAELSAVGLRLAGDFPQSYRDLRPRVRPYGRPGESSDASAIRTVMYSVNVIFGLLLVVVCANVGTLVFARTATRAWEITVRNALGASRARILSQLFVEALVLAGLAAALGLVAAKFGLIWAFRLLAGLDTLPFWLDNSLSPATVGYAALLMLVGASIVGILPALRITKQGVQDMLRNESAARAGLRFGGFWTGVIIVQVAITVAFLPLAGGGAFESNRFQKRAAALHAERYLAARVAMDPEKFSVADSIAFVARSRASYRELERRLAAEPGVERVTFANRLPGMDEYKYPIEVDTTLVKPGPNATRTVTASFIAPGFFDAFNTSVVAGRNFAPGDYDSSRVVIVNQSFAHHVLGDRNPIGQRVRMRQDDGKGDWYEIVGMIKDFGWALDSPVEQSAMYYPRALGPTGALFVTLRLRGDPEAFAPRLRAIALAVDETMMLYDVVPLSEIGGPEARMNWALTAVAALVSMMVLLLSATGIHSLMAFTVARRTREIGIRAALGAHPGRIVAGIFSRAGMQLGLGIVAGSVLAGLFGLQNAREIALLVSAVVVMLLVGLGACAVPLRRALRIDPTEALRMEA